MATYLKQLQVELETAIAGVTGEAWQKSPVGKWNSAQILEHLYLSYRNTNKGIAKVLETGTSLATGATMTYRLRTLVVLGLGHIPTGMEAPARVVPRGLPFAEVHSGIFREIESMSAGLDACERRFGAGTAIMDNPRLGPLTSEQWRKFHLIHGKHHARQIRERSKL